MFDTEIPIICISLLVAALMIAVAVVAFGLRPLRAVASCRRREHESIPDFRTPMVSVVVHASADTAEVSRFLDMMAGQIYPSLETIVVFDASQETAEMLAEELSAKYPEVHFTFIPRESHNLSRPKLAVTVGVKAAAGDVIVTTASNALIPSPYWISDIAGTFAANPCNEVTLGYSHMDFSELHGPGRWYRQFDSVLTASQWLGSAACGTPYRGDRYNLAFRRETFVRNKGYARTINLHNGHDDLFVSEIARRDNTSLLLDTENILTMEWGSAAGRVWTIRKEGYMFTRRWLKRGPFLLAAVTSLSQWLVAGCCAAAIVTGLPDIIPTIVATVILLSFWGCEIHAYRRAAARLGAVRLWWAVVPFWMFRPLANALFRVVHHSQRIKNYTWQRR